MTKKIVFLISIASVLSGFLVCPLISGEQLENQRYVIKRELIKQESGMPSESQIKVTDKKSSKEVFSARPKDFGFEDIGQLYVTDKCLYVFESGIEMGLNRIEKIDFSEMRPHRIDLSDLQIQSDYAFNPKNGKIIGSDLPWFGDVTGAESWEKRKNKVTLVLYDVESAKKSVIAVSINRGFSPKWIDEKMFEYNDPDSGKRVSKVIKN